MKLVYSVTLEFSLPPEEWEKLSDDDLQHLNDSLDELTDSMEHQGFEACRVLGHKLSVKRKD